MPPPPARQLSGSNQRTMRRPAPTTAGTGQQQQRNRQLHQQLTLSKADEQQRQFEKLLVDVRDLTAEDKEKIIAVLDRDAAIRKYEQTRVM